MWHLSNVGPWLDLATVAEQSSTNLNGLLQLPNALTGLFSIHIKILQLQYLILRENSIVDVSLLRIVGGEFSFEDSTGYEQVRGVNRIIPYSRYNYETLEGDLALLEVIFS